MANTQKINDLKSKIAKLKKGLGSKASASLKAKANAQIAKYESEIKELKGTKATKKATGKTTTVSKAKALSAKIRGSQGLSKSKSDIEKDANRPALKAGKRISKDGNKYYEYRENRIDRRPQKYARLEHGGGTNKQEWVAIFQRNKGMGNEQKVIPSYGNTKEEAIRDAMISRPHHGITNDWELVNIYTYSGNLPMMAKGGATKNKTYKLVPMISAGVQGYLTPSYSDIVKFTGTEDEAFAKAKELVNSDPRFVRVETKIEMKTKTITVGVSEKSYADGGVYKKGGDTIKLNDTVIYYEKEGNILLSKGKFYAWLYDEEDAGAKISSGEYDFILFPTGGGLSLAMQKDYVPPLLKIWTKSFQKDKKGIEHLLGIVQGYYDDKENKLYIEMMTTNPKFRRMGIIGHIIKQVREEFGVSQDNVIFDKPTDMGNKFMASKKFADGGAITDIGGTKFSTTDLSGMFEHGGELHRSQERMYAKGGLMEHGLMIGDMIVSKGEIFPTVILVKNEGEYYGVDLDTGERFNVKDKN